MIIFLFNFLLEIYFIYAVENILSFLKRNENYSKKPFSIFYLKLYQTEPIN